MSAGKPFPYCFVLGESARHNGPLAWALSAGLSQESLSHLELYSPTRLAKSTTDNREINRIPRLAVDAQLTTVKLTHGQQLYLALIDYIESMKSVSTTKWTNSPRGPTGTPTPRIVLKPYSSECP